MASGPIECGECENSPSDGTEIVFCSGCNFNLCIECWEKKVPHRKKLLGPGGIPHDKVPPQIVEELKACTAPPETEEEQRNRHLEDENTYWFGMAQDHATGRPVFDDHNRYARIMAGSASGSGQSRHPKLVSFIGDTGKLARRLCPMAVLIASGAGKSTLINLLIDLKQSGSSDNPVPRSSPVVGKESSSVPTSADVHLYSDPETYFSPSPILYADCEGMKGGESQPIAKLVSDGAHHKKSGAPINPPRDVTETYGPIDKLIHGTKRFIEWFKQDAADTEKRIRREFAVTEMYPRILYAFSDVIVFVLRNAR